MPGGAGRSRHKGDEANLRNKVSRGGFSAGFFVQCLTAIGAHTVRLHEAD
ncbi:MAG: DUF6471 domain-containing protein [Caulobacteraceae bacterium]